MKKIEFTEANELVVTTTGENPGDITKQTIGAGQIEAHLDMVKAELTPAQLVKAKAIIAAQ